MIVTLSELQVIFMFGRLWHLWLLAKARYFRHTFEIPNYTLGNTKTLVEMMRHWDNLDDALGVKMLCKSYPFEMLCGASACLLVLSAYFYRVAETPVNENHSGRYWNDLWLAMVRLDKSIVSHFDYWNSHAVAVGRPEPRVSLSVSLPWSCLCLCVATRLAQQISFRIPPSTDLTLL